MDSPGSMVPADATKQLSNRSFTHRPSILLPPKTDPAPASPVTMSSPRLFRYPQERANTFLKVGNQRQCDHCGQMFGLVEFELHREEVRKARYSEAQYTLFQEFFLRPLFGAGVFVIVHCFFREVHIFGRENLPKEGPVVFFANHQNQFIDASVLRDTCGRPCRYVAAKKSLNPRTIVGILGRLSDAIGVVRPQDVPSEPATGMLTAIVGDKIHGEGTRFLHEFAYGDILKWQLPCANRSSTVQVLSVESDTLLTVSQPVAEADQIRQPLSIQRSKRIDNSKMYGEVYDTFRRGDTIGIFPEGISHDMTSLQPLKAGVALFSLSAADEKVPIPKLIPCGITYFHGHRFRSVVYVEYGKPMTPPPRLIEMFKYDKRKAVTELLEDINAELRAVTLNVTDYKALKYIHCFARFIVPHGLRIDPQEFLRLARRLSIIVDEEAENQGFKDFEAAVQKYLKDCKRLHVRDRQVVTLMCAKDPEFRVHKRLVARRTITVLFLGLLLLPYCIVISPVLLLSHYVAWREAMKEVKLGTSLVGVDVVASVKVRMGILLLPLSFCCFALWTFLYVDKRVAGAVLVALPMTFLVLLQLIGQLVLEYRATAPLYLFMLGRKKDYIELYDRRNALIGTAWKLIREFDVELENEMQTIIDERGLDRDALPSLFSLRPHGTGRFLKLRKQNAAAAKKKVNE